LPHPVIQAPLPLILVIAVVLPAFPPPGLPTTSRAAVTLASLAAPADKEQLATYPAKLSSEYELYTGGHLPTRRDWTKTAELCEAFPG
jgi:hypothetical protein